MVITKWLKCVSLFTIPFLWHRYYDQWSLENNSYRSSKSNWTQKLSLSSGTKKYAFQLSIPLTCLYIHNIIVDLHDNNCSQPLSLSLGSKVHFKNTTCHALRLVKLSLGVFSIAEDRMDHLSWLCFYSSIRSKKSSFSWLNEMWLKCSGLQQKRSPSFINMVYVRCVIRYHISLQHSVNESES